MAQESKCPGCALVMPVLANATYEGYFNTSPECWQVFTEVLATEYNNALLFGRVHQLTVDTYAVHHAGGKHPDKSVGIHFAGLYLMLTKRAKTVEVPRLHRRLAESVKEWPHFTPPVTPVYLTIFNVAMAETPDEHVRLVREWANAVWTAWAEHHDAVATLVAEKLRKEIS